MSTALIVEDDPAQAKIVAGLLARRDLRSLIADTGELGLRLARLVRPELILLDLMLPDADGFEVCRRLRSDERTMTTPVVMLTALDDSNYRRRGFRVGANAYLTKPYEPEDLFEAVENARQWRADLERTRVQGEIHVELNSETVFLQEVNEFLTELCRRTPLTAEQVMHLRQAVMEMGQNAIEWGNRHRAEKLVNITYRVFDDRVVIIVRDQGTGFDPENLPHAASPDDPLRHMDVREKLGLREGGFGLLIARGMLDELHFNDLGNEVTLIKRFSTTDEPKVR